MSKEANKEKFKESSPTPDSAMELAIRFHEAYERLAPRYKYETKPETREFDPQTPNGRLMIAVCREIIERNAMNNKEKVNEYNRKYYQAHREEILPKKREYNKRYYQTHKEEILAKRKEYYKKKKEERKNEEQNNSGSGKDNSRDAFNS